MDFYHEVISRISSPKLNFHSVILENRYSIRPCCSHTHHFIGAVGMDILVDTAKTLGRSIVKYRQMEAPLLAKVIGEFFTTIDLGSLQ